MSKGSQIEATQAVVAEFKSAIRAGSLSPGEVRAVAEIHKEGLYAALGALSDFSWPLTAEPPIPPVAH